MIGNWQFASVFSYWDVLLAGMVGTLQLFVVTVLLGLGGGLVLGICRYSRNPALRYPAILAIEVFRNVPVLVQIVWFFYALPILLPMSVSPFMAAVLGISLNTMAFSAEIYRAGIQSIEPSQWEAGKAIGMRYAQTMRIVILPQAIRRVLPALTNRGIEAFKMSTLGLVVGNVETLGQAKLIASIEYNPIEAYTVVALLFFVVMYPMIKATYVLERRFGRSE